MLTIEVFVMDAVTEPTFTNTTRTVVNRMTVIQTASAMSSCKIILHHPNKECQLREVHLLYYGKDTPQVLQGHL